jgi:isopenicillin N synthase-like dioxygenase
MRADIPVIDVAPFLAGSLAGKRTVARAMGEACMDLGFFSIVGHGVPPALMRRMLDISRAFFDLPLTEKLKVKQPRPEQSRGYIGLGQENLSYSRGDRSTADLKELFAIGPIDVPDEPYYYHPDAYPSFAANVWPAQPAAFRAVWTEYYRTLEKLAWSIMRMCALALALPEDFFWRYIDKHISGIRVNHYPEQQVEPQPGQIRAGAHTDYGAVTILLPENVPGGLQVLTRQGDWADVETPDGAFVCNLGDLMQHWTNDRWVSTMHRVVNPPRHLAVGNRRLSIPFFHQPNYDALIECLPGCCGPGNPPRYVPITSGAHRLQKFTRGMGGRTTTA